MPGIEDLDLEHAAALADALEEEPALAFDQAMARLASAAGIVREFKRGSGALITYMRHARLGAVEAMVKLATIDPDDKTGIVILQSGVGDYLRLCRYMADVLSVGRAGVLADSIADGVGDGEGSSIAKPRRRRKADDGG